MSIKFVVALCSIASLFCAPSYAAELFSGSHVARGPDDSPAYKRYSLSAFNSQVDIHALATSGLNFGKDSATLDVSLPDGERIKVAASRFVPIEGFAFDEEGEVILDPDA